MTGMKGIALLAVCGMVAGATAAVSDIASFVDAPRTYNDFGGSTLAFSSSYSPNAGMVSIDESNYGSGGFANRHMAWYGDAGASKVDFDYGDGWDMKMTMRVNTADSVGNVEAGYQFDLFGFGLFGVLTTTGEIAAFGSVMPFHSFGQGLYNVGDEIMLRMIHRPGAGEGNLSDKSTMEYMYNNLTTGSGWVTSGEIDFTTNEGGIPSSFPFYVGAGAQINQPDATLGHANIEFYDMMIPAPASLALLGLGGLVATRRRR
ncbi:MAG: PEP-CTERM sorting domain-containing protein [Phycisphaeraceae bacterium]|nr:MAG: PEP-CTERM sorting domain-containing protein [Phycisphaeraceae bacterium]